MLCHQRTASLCIYCVRRWVLSFYFFCCAPPPHPSPYPKTPHPPSHYPPLPFLFFVDVEIVSALCSFSGDQWVGLCLGEWERRCGGTVCASRIERDEMPARVGRTCGFGASVGIPCGLCFLSSFKPQLSSETVWNVKVLWVFVLLLRTFSLGVWLDVNAVPVWVLCSLLVTALSLCEDVMLRSGLCGVGDSESEFASELWGWCGECLTSSHRKIVFEVLTNAFSMFCDSKGSLK